MSRRQPRSTRTHTLFPNTTSSDLGSAAGARLRPISEKGPIAAQYSGAASGCQHAGGRTSIATEREVRLAGRRKLRAELSRSEEHTSEPQSLMHKSYAVLCVRKKTTVKKLHDNANKSRRTTR